MNNLSFENTITAVIPVYNVEKYADFCIRSVANQSYKNIEIILVDDGATDSSAEICEKWLLKDNRIKVIHKQNGGLSDARNYGLEIANGEYVCFIDSDDYIEPTIFENALKKSEEHNSNIVVWGYFKDFVDGQNTVSKQEKHGISGICSLCDGYRFLLQDDILGVTGYAWNKLYKKELLDKNGFRFQKGISLVEDVLFNVPVMCECDEILYIDTIGTHYIQRNRETLGTKLYGNHFELKMRAIECKCRLLEHFGADKNTVENFRGTEYISMLRSMIRIIANLPLEYSEKYKKMAQLLADIKESNLTDSIVCRNISDKIVTLLLKLNCKNALLIAGKK